MIPKNFPLPGKVVSKKIETGPVYLDDNGVACRKVACLFETIVTVAELEGKSPSDPNRLTGRTRLIVDNGTRYAFPGFSVKDPTNVTLDDVKSWLVAYGQRTNPVIDAVSHFKLDDPNTRIIIEQWTIRGSSAGYLVCKWLQGPGYGVMSHFLDRDHPVRRSVEEGPTKSVITFVPSAKPELRVAIVCEVENDVWKFRCGDHCVELPSDWSSTLEHPIDAALSKLATNYDYPKSSFILRLTSEQVRAIGLSRSVRSFCYHRIADLRDPTNPNYQYGLPRDLYGFRMQVWGTPSSTDKNLSDVVPTDRTYKYEPMPEAKSPINEIINKYFDDNISRLIMEQSIINPPKTTLNDNSDEDDVQPTIVNGES